jgi:hypothetical protein
MTARDRIEQMYAEHAGDDALARQRQERVERHPCCGERTTDRLFDLPPASKLTDRQTVALTAITTAGYDGLHTDEVGAAVHHWQGKHPGETCEWCPSVGKEIGRRLRELGLVQQRRRKAPGGDSVLVWTVAGRLDKPRVVRPGDGIPF